jgi:hypothetical protein
MKHPGLVILLAAMTLPAHAGPPPEARDGQIYRDATSGELLAWDEATERWLEPIAFWQAFAARRGGLTWDRATSYPPYDEVEEHDSFIVETREGLCLMWFFHGRWRRANDVWRWDPAFDEVGGCRVVFD